MNRRTVGIASLIYGASILLSRLIGLVRESVIGRTLGGGQEADAYWTAFVLPDFLNYLLAGGVLSIVFIPMFAGYLTRDDEVGGWTAFSQIANALCLLLIPLTIILWVITPSLTEWIAPGMTGEQHHLLVKLTRIILPAQFFHLLGGLISATLQARDRHFFPALAPIVYTASIVVGGLLLAPSIGAKGFAWGVLAGSIMGPFALPFFAAYREGMKWSFQLRFRHPDLREYAWKSIPVMLGFSIIILDDMLLKHFGSALESGGISRMQYAKTLMKVPMGVFGLAASVAAYPTLSRMLARGETSSAMSLINDALRMMMVLAFIAQSVLFAAGTEMAEVIWGKTRFSADELASIGHLTFLFSIGLFAWSGQTLVARGFYARGNTWLPTVVGSLVVLVAYPIYGLLSENYGANGLGYASAGAVLLYFFTLLIILTKQLTGGLNSLLPVIIVIVKMGVATAVGMTLTHLTFTQFSVDHPFLRGGLSGLFAIAYTVGMGLVLRVNELTLLFDRIKARLSST